MLTLNALSLSRELTRQSNRSVIEKIHAAEDQKKDYRAYIESWVHEIKAPITSISHPVHTPSTRTQQISIRRQASLGYAVAHKKTASAAIQEK